MRQHAMRAIAVDDDGDRPVAAVERALAILDAFRKDDAVLSLAELAARTGLYKSTIGRLGATLEQHGYLERTSDGGFNLGPRLLHLGMLYQNAIRPADIILPIMTELATETGESASYSVRRGDVRVCVYRIDSPNALRHHVAVGDVFPVGKGCSGRILLAFAEPPNPAHAALRNLMIATSSEELSAGTSGMAAPVFDAAGTICGVLSLSGPKSRFNKAAMCQARRPLLAAGRLITQRFGGPVALYDRALQAPQPAAKGANRA